MAINQILMCILAFGVALGGVDRVLGNRFGYGEKFENGFKMLGTVGLSMAGIICLAPLLGNLMGLLVRPVCAALGIDPSIFGSILAIDMGGYSLAQGLARVPVWGQYSGVIVASVFGCTLVYNIPVGVGFLGERDDSFITGILLGLAAMPFALLAGGLMMGLGVRDILWNSLPVFLLSAALALGVKLAPEAMMRGFQVFAKLIRAVATLGLTAAAVTHMTGFVIIPGMPPLLDAMKTVSSICIVMLGSMPMAELMQRLLRKPFRWFGQKTGIDSAGTAALLVSLVSATPALALLPEMNKRSRVIVSAFLVSGVCTFGAHFAFAESSEPELVPAMLLTKLLGGLLGAAVAMIFAPKPSEA